MKPTVLAILLLLTGAAFGQTKLFENTNLYGGILNGKPMLVDSVGNLWTTDGTPAGTKIFTTKVRMDVSTTLRSGRGLTMGTKVYFAGKAAASGVELWCTDGTDAGTFQVKDIKPGTGSSDPGEFFPVNNSICFSANDGVHGSELWISDGSPGGTKLLKDLTGDAHGSSLYPYGSVGIARLGSSVYFYADDSLHGYEVWKTDGTESGTKMLKDINPFNTGLDEAGNLSIATLGNSIYFFANNGQQGNQLWRSDGTEAGTAMVKNITAGTQRMLTNPELYVFNNKLYFTTQLGTAAELWISDGTSNGTSLVKAFATSLFVNSIDLSQAVNFSGKFMFAYNYYDNTFQLKAELWTTDGTAGNTTKIFTSASARAILVSLKYDDVYEDQSNHVPPFNGKVFFSTIDYLQNTGELWLTDGTSGGTTNITNKLFGGYFSNTLYGATGFYFWGGHSTHADSISLYKTNGTPGGASAIQSFPRPAATQIYSFPFINFEYNGDVYYCANDKKDNSPFNDFFRSGKGGSVPPPVTGTYTFTGNGSWDLPSNWQNNQVPPANLSGGEIIIDPAAGGECVVTGAKTLPAGVKLTLKSNKKLRFTN